MTDMIDGRVAAWICAWNAIQDAQKLKQPPKGPRVQPEPLPESYWSAMTEAAILANLACADTATGLAAGTMINAVETAKQAALDMIGDLLGTMKAQRAERPPRQPSFTEGQNVLVTRGDWAGRYGQVYDTHLDNEPPMLDIELDPPGRPSDPSEPVQITVLTTDVELAER